MDTENNSTAETEEATQDKKPSPKKKLTNKAIAGIVAGVAAVAIVAGVGIYAVANPAQEAEPAAQQAEQVQADTEVQFAIDAPDWNQDSSAAIAHIAGKTYEGDDVDFYHAFQPAEEAHAVTLASGDYEVEWVTPINSDGSLYKVPEKQELKVPTVDQPAAEPDPVKSDASMEKVPADQVSADDLNKALDQIGEAVAKGDDTLTGDAGTAVADKAAENASKNPNADKGAVEEKKQQAEQKANEAKPSESKADTGAKSNSSSTSGSSQSSGQTSQAATHTHNWVYHEAQYTTKHHDAQYKTVHHDAVYGTYSYSVCATCGAESPSNEHKKAHLRAGENSATKGASRQVLKQAAYDEQVLVKDAYDEQVLVKAAYYSCSCDATK